MFVYNIRKFDIQCGTTCICWYVYTAHSVIWDCSSLHTPRVVPNLERKRGQYLTYRGGHLNMNQFDLFDSSSHFLSEYIGTAYAELLIRSVNHQPWRFTNNILGPPQAHSLSVCLYLWVCVLCVWFLLYLCFYLCCAHCVFCVLFYIHNHLFVFFLHFLQI